MNKSTIEPPEWLPVPGSPGIERNTKTGRLRTNISPPPVLPPRSAPWSPPKGWPPSGKTAMQGGERP